MVAANKNNISLQDDKIDERWICSPEIVRQYTESDKNIVLNRQLGSGEKMFWMATDDLGFIHGEELFVIGRKSDLIISSTKVKAHLPLSY